MKKIDYIIKTLNALGSERIGLLEAATLLAIANGADTKQDILKQTTQHPDSMTTRIRCLRAKGLIKSAWTKEGTQKHDLTSAGVKLCHRIINQESK